MEDESSSKQLVPCRQRKTHTRVYKPFSSPKWPLLLKCSGASGLKQRRSGMGQSLGGPLRVQGKASPCGRDSCPAQPRAVLGEEGVHVRAEACTALGGSSLAVAISEHQGKSAA